VHCPLRAQAHARKIDETRARMTEEERAERSAQLARTMALLVHASGCASPDCASSNCAKVKGLFHHAVSCPLKVAGGCQLCRWVLETRALPCPCPCPAPALPAAHLKSCPKKLRST
jgi:E1A/CREB-binding protein